MRIQIISACLQTLLSFLLLFGGFRGPPAFLALADISAKLTWTSSIKSFFSTSVSTPVDEPGFVATVLNFGTYFLRSWSSFGKGKGWAARALSIGPK